MDKGSGAAGGAAVRPRPGPEGLPQLEQARGQLRLLPPDQRPGWRIGPQLRGQSGRHRQALHRDERGWPLLYNDDTNKPKREESVQLLFKGIVQHYCLANGVRVDREVYLGKGPVDFAFTKSAFERGLLEIKKMTNTDYWNGLEKQLTSYLTSDQCSFGWFLAVRYDDKAVSVSRTNDLPKRTASAAKETGFDLRAEWIDARRKASASNL
ncbi:hypothetical protein [Gordonia cholesterolivorans]|uniref:Uncharacterized protein n=1 Tax=Gordonia cholesterolivorans TaxID=559625 RepID=A0ABN3HSD8_9ACTN